MLPRLACVGVLSTPIGLKQLWRHPIALITTAKLNGVEPIVYLTNMLKRANMLKRVVYGRTKAQ